VRAFDESFIDGIAEIDIGKAIGPTSRTLVIPASSVTLALCAPISALLATVVESSW
jgi:hypothetical protein